MGVKGTLSVASFVTNVKNKEQGYKEEQIIKAFQCVMENWKIWMNGRLRKWCWRNLDMHRKRKRKKERLCCLMKKWKQHCWWANRTKTGFRKEAGKFLNGITDRVLNGNSEFFQSFTDQFWITAMYFLKYFRSCFKITDRVFKKHSATGLTIYRLL